MSDRPPARWRRGAAVMAFGIAIPACAASTAQPNDPTATAMATSTGPASTPTPSSTSTTTTTTNTATATTTKTATATAIGPPVPSTISTATGPPAGPSNGQPWTVSFGGDALLTRRIAAAADPFARIRPPLAEADLAIVNVETAIATGGRAEAKTYTFRSDPSFATRLGDAGVDVVSLANNHALDFGRQALLDTIDNLRAAGVEPVGAGADLAAALQPADLVINGVRVAVLGGSQIIPNAGWLATTTRAGIASAGKHVIDTNSDNLLRAVRAARATHDVVLVVMHWGIEGDPCPSPVQRRLGALLRAAGATAVLGAHPHILQPIVPDRVVGADGLVAYSLGNFIWDPRGGATGDTGVLQLQFRGGRLVGHHFTPHRLDGNGWAAALDPVTAAGRRVTARVARSCPGAAGVASSGPLPTPGSTALPTTALPTTTPTAPTPTATTPTATTPTATTPTATTPTATTPTV